MIRLVRSELRKFFTTKLWWGMALGVLAAGFSLAALFGALTTGLLPDEQAGPGSPAFPTFETDPTAAATSVYTGGISTAYLLLLTIGILISGSETRHKTLTATFLASPKRWPALLAKTVAVLIIGVLYGLLTLLGSVTVGAAIIAARGFTPFPGPDVWRSLALSLLVLGLWGLIGLGVGFLISNQVAAILVAVGVAWIVEPLLGLALAQVDWANQHIVPYLPSSASQAVLGTQPPGGGQTQLEWWTAALVLAGYAAVAAGLGTWRIMRADIS